jgi:hypothetical protein
MFFFCSYITKGDLFMTNMITLNVKTRVDLRDVYLIERVTPKDVERLVARTGLPEARMSVFRSNVRFIDGTNILAVQDFEEIAARADNRFIAVRLEAEGGGQAQVSQIVPMDAIRHFEMVTGEDRQAMKTRYADTDAAKIDALKTRLVYFGLDPETVGNRQANFFQKMFPVDLKQDLRGTQRLEMIDIGHGRFVLTSEIVEARNLSEAELQSLARKYNVRSEKDGDLTTSITLRSGDLIMSSLPAENIMAQINPAPQPTVRNARRSARPVAVK